MGILDVDCTSNLKYHIEDLLDLWAKPKIPPTLASQIQLHMSQMSPIEISLM